MAARVDPYKNYRFLVELEGIIQAGFSDCSGFGSAVEVIEYREGGDPATVRKLPGKTSYHDLVLKWGITDSHELYDWFAQVTAGNVQPKNGSVVLLDDTGSEKVRWNFFTAWPSKYDAPTLTGKGNDVAIETMTICCERLERAAQ